MHISKLVVLKYDYWMKKIGIKNSSSNINNNLPIKIVEKTVTRYREFDIFFLAHKL